MSNLSNSQTLRTFIVDTNARHQGVEISDLMEQAGAGIAAELLQKYGKQKTYAFLCGKGNNGGDGFSAARHLATLGAKQVTIYLVGRANKITSPAAIKHWELAQLTKEDYPNLMVRQDCYAGDIENHDVLIECLVGTGLKGNLKRRFRDVIARTTHFRRKIVAVDVPVPGYSWDLSLSMMYPKTPDAITIDIGMPDSAELYTGPGEVKSLFVPRKDSYKTQNGKLLIIGGSNNYHGAPILATEAASKYAGLVYFHFSAESAPSIKHKFKSALAEFINVESKDLEKSIIKSDAILIGPGWEENITNKALLNHIIANYTDKKIVLDAGAIRMADLSLVARHGQILFTPNGGEINSLLKLASTRSNASTIAKLRRFSRDNNCFVNLKGSQSLIAGYNPMAEKVDVRINKSGNRGMGKGGSGDLLAGITAAFATKNDLWLATVAGAFISGLAGDLALQKYGYMYNPDNTIEELHAAWKWCKDF